MTMTTEERMEAQAQVKLEGAARALQQASSDVEWCVLATPTGDRRNKLCDLQIELGRLQETVAKLQQEAA